MSGVFNFITSLISRIDPTIYDNGSHWPYFGALLTSCFAAFGQIIVGWFYSICKWFLAFVDFLQYFVQKLIGLDYWLNSTSYSLRGAVDNDVLFSFLFDDTVQRVFRAMIGVFFVLLIIFTIIQIIRQEWQYITGEKFGDGKGNSKAIIIKNSIKAIAIVILFPIILTVSIVSSNAILASLVKALNIDMSSTFGATLFQISSQNASKYQDYASNDARLPSSDKVTFYTIWSNQEGTAEEIHSPLYLKISSTDVADNNYKISYANVRYELTEYETYPASLDVNMNTYYNLIYQCENNSAEEGVTLGNTKFQMKKNTVNSIFNALNPKKTDKFTGFCVGLDFADGRHYYMVDSCGDNEGMYHYLHNVLTVPIMRSGHDIDNKVIYDDVNGGSLSSVEGVSCLISELNIHGINSSGSDWGVDDACYNTWTYSTVYNVSQTFASSEHRKSITNSTFLGNMGLSFERITTYINGDNYSQYFDGGQLGNVQLRSEYYVMAEVLNFMQTNDVGLYVMNANSSNIDWNYGEYAPESRWVSNYVQELQKDIMINSSSVRARSRTLNYLPFVVSYKEEAPEPGNILYMSKYGATNEIEGAKYILCWKVTQGTSSVYVPLINGKTFTDPATGKSYRFTSDYYNSTYRGVVIAKGSFDASHDGTEATRGNPTYLANMIERNLENGTSAAIDSNTAYYYNMLQTGSVDTYAKVSNPESEDVGNVKNFRIKSISTGSADTGTSEATETYSGHLVKGLFDPGAEAEGHENYNETDGYLNTSEIEQRLVYAFLNSEGEQVSVPETSMESLRIVLTDMTTEDYDGPAAVRISAIYAGQKTDTITDDAGNRYTFYLYRTENSSHYFRVAYLVTQDNKVYITVDGKIDDSDRSPDIEFDNKKTSISAIYLTYDLYVDYNGVTSQDGKTTFTNQTVISGIPLSSFNHEKENLYSVPGQDVLYTNGGDGPSENRYETIYVYLNTDNSTFFDISTKIGDGIDEPYVVLKEASNSKYQAYYYTFYLYNFLTGIDNDNKLYSYNDGTVNEITALPTDLDWTFVAKISASDFSWPDDQLSYVITNGNTYVATLYKTSDQKVATHNDLRGQTISVNRGGDIYYNIYTNNKFDNKDAIQEYYDGLMDDFIIGCYRDNIKIDFSWLDINSFGKLFTEGRMRIYLSFGVPIMNRGIKSMEFTLENGLKFDYFFSKESTVGLSDLYIASKISYWIMIIASILIIKVLGKAIWGIIKRFYTITLYFIAMPASASLIPFGGDRFKTNIQTPLIQEILSTYGIILGINVFFILLMPVKSISNIFTQADIETSGSYFLTHLPFSASILNTYVYILFVLVAFTMIDSLPETISKLVGGKDVVSEGEKTKKAASASLQSAAKTWSGQGLIEGGKNLLGGAAQVVPGLALAKGAKDVVDNGIDAARRRFHKGEEEGDGEGGEGGSGQEGNSREEEGGEGEEGGETSVENAETGAPATPSASSRVEEMTGLTESDAAGGSDAVRAVYEAAESMADMSDEEVAESDQRQFNQEAVENGADVFGADFDLDQARISAFRNGVGTDAGMTAAAIDLANGGGLEGNITDPGKKKTFNEAKLATIRSTMSEDEQKKFDEAYASADDAGKQAMLDAYKLSANADGSIVVTDSNNVEQIAGREASAAMLSAVAQTVDASKISTAITNGAVDTGVLDAALANNIAAGVDFSQATGASARVLDMARNDEGMQVDALMAAIVDPSGKVTDNNMLAMLRGSGVAIGDDGTISDPTQLKEFVQRNKDSIMQKVDPKKFDEAFKGVVGDRVRSGEFKVTAWDLQAAADPSKLAEFSAQRQAIKDNAAAHNVLEDAGNQEKAAILTAIAGNLEGTAVGAKIKAALGRGETDAIGALSEEDIKKLDESGLTEILARAGAIDRDLTKNKDGVETATTYAKSEASRRVRTAEEIEMESDLSLEQARQALGEDAELLANTFTNSSMDGQADIASAALRSVLGKDLSDGARRDVLKDVGKKFNIQDLKAQGFSEDDIVLAQQATGLLGGDLMANLTALRDDPNSMLKTIMAGDKAALKGSVGEYLSANLSTAQMGELVDLAAGSSFATMNATQQEDALVALARDNGAIMEELGAGAKDDDIRKYLATHQDAKDKLIKRANETSYFAAHSSEADIDGLKMAVAKKKQIDAVLATDGASISAEDIMGTIDSADDKVKQAFIDTYIDKAGIIGEDEQKKLRTAAAREYLAKKRGLDPKKDKAEIDRISDVDIAKALDEDAGAMEAADEAVRSASEKRLKLGLGGRTALVANAVMADKKLRKKAEADFRAQFGSDLENADELTKRAFYAKYESQLSDSDRRDIDESYLKKLNIGGLNEVTKKRLLKEVANGTFASIDDALTRDGKGFAFRDNLEEKDILSRLTKDTDAFQAVYDSLSREQGQEGVDIIAAAKRSYISAVIDKDSTAQTITGAQAVYRRSDKKDRGVLVSALLGSTLTAEETNDTRRDAARQFLERMRGKTDDTTYLNDFFRGKTASELSEFGKGMGKKGADIQLYFKNGQLYKQSEKHKKQTVKLNPDDYKKLMSAHPELQQYIDGRRQVSDSDITEALKSNKGAIDAANEAVTVAARKKLGANSDNDVDRLLQTDTGLFEKALKAAESGGSDVAKRIRENGTEAVFDEGKQARFKAGIEIDPSTLSAAARRDYDYNKGVLSKEVMQSGRIDLLKNIFDNVDFVGKSKALAEMQAKGLSFEEMLKSNEALKTKLINLGAQDMRLTLTEQSLRSKEADVIKNNEGLKNDLLAFIKNEIANSKDKNKTAAALGIDLSKVNDINNLKFEEIKDINAAISARRAASSTFAKTLSDGVTSDVSYAGHATEDDKQRFFDNQAAEAAAEARKKKYKHISDAFDGFTTTSITGHAVQSVLFKLTKKLPEHSAAYDNYNRKIQMQINAIEADNSLSRAEKDVQIRQLEAKKVITKLPENWAKMSAEEQRAYKEQQVKNKRIAFKEGNFNWVSKSGLAIKGAAGNVAVATSNVARAVGVKLGSAFSFLPFARTEGVKTNHRDKMSDIAARISRFNASKSSYRDDVEFGVDFATLAASYGLSAEKLAKKYDFADEANYQKLLKDYQDDVKNGRSYYAQTNLKKLQDLQKRRKEAIEQELNRRYRVASKKVARDEGENKRSFFDGYGIGEENVRFKEANTKYLQVQSHINTHLPIPFINKAVNAAVTHSRMKNVSKVEAGDGNRYSRWRYDRIYGRKTEDSGIKAQNNIINAQNMLAELQKFNETYGKSGNENQNARNYMKDLFDNFKQKFGEQLTRDMLKKLEISKDGTSFKMGTFKAAVTRGWQGESSTDTQDFSKYAMSIQTREIEKMLLNQMKQQQRRAMFSSAIIPASSEAAGAFVGKTMTGARTKVQVENDRLNAENLNKILRQIQAQNGIVDYSKLNLQELLGSAIYEKFQNSSEFKKLIKSKATDDASQYDALQNFVRRELDKANNRVHNNSLLRDDKYKLQKLNGIYVDRKEIRRGSEEARNSFRANQDPVFNRINRDYHTMRNVVKNQEIEVNKVIKQIQNMRSHGMSEQTKRELRKLQRQLYDMQQELERNKEKLAQTRARYDAKLDSFAAQSLAQRSAGGQNYTINSNAPLDVKINAKIPDAERARLEREIRQSVLERAKQDLSAINTRSQLTPEMESKIKSILGSYNFNEKLGRVPGLMSKLQSELESEINRLQDKAHAEVRARTQELLRKLKASETDYSARQRRLEQRIKELEKQAQK